MTSSTEREREERYVVRQQDLRDMLSDKHIRLLGCTDRTRLLHGGERESESSREIESESERAGQKERGRVGEMERVKQGEPAAN